MTARGTSKGYDVHIDREGDEFIASVPVLPGCATVGDTPEAAAADIGGAIDGWIAMAQKLGRHIPKPRAA